MSTEVGSKLRFSRISVFMCRVNAVWILRNSSPYLLMTAEAAIAAGTASVDCGGDISTAAGTETESKSEVTVVMKDTSAPSPSNGTCRAWHSSLGRPFANEGAAKNALPGNPRRTRWRSSLGRVPASKTNAKKTGVPYASRRPGMNFRTKAGREGNRWTPLAPKEAPFLITTELRTWLSKEY